MTFPSVRSLLPSVLGPPSSYQLLAGVLRDAGFGEVRLLTSRETPFTVHPSSDGRVRLAGRLIRQPDQRVLVGTHTDMSAIKG